ncbi:FAD-dependent monooxygenase [Aaosphaeria arxii CBS 175.79]|uniref:FAD-dependent monooxygenase n=1 Tax=Aaosphaeria arxii CBS 175.79 TaxID=1450172 RepID=A0A6A5X7C5_9PLEO|nr:FAD-dependent monooxygenase [Aaosphaeria arxii CBS 175.79]KAF2008819.1 FAD-dependent monooxygenase [Aaosphaeria arxii CBS 175.79]
MKLQLLLISLLLQPIRGDSACKNNPLDRKWPILDNWSALNESVNGALIKANPVAATCFANSSFTSTTNCDTVQKRWFESAFQAEQPESIGYPYWANNSCVPPNDYAYRKGQQCELGGLPSYILNATTAEQIAVAAKWASSRDIRIVVKGTGHDLNGRSSGANSLSIWTKHIQNIDFNSSWPHPIANKTENVMIVGSGQNWGTALRSAASVGRTVVSGQDPTVGLGGFIGGGGHGPLSSHYGLAADQVLQATVVTTEGQILIANDAQNQDLLWAIRGGGPGLYGIVTEYVLRTYPLPENVVLGTLSMSVTKNDTREASASWTALASLCRSIPDLMDSGLTGNGFALTKDITHNVTRTSDKAVELSLMFFGYNTTASAFKSLLEPVIARMASKEQNETLSVTLSEPTVLPSYSALFEVLNPGPSRCGDISLTSSRLLGRPELTDLPEDELRTHLQNIMNVQVTGRQSRLVFGLQGGPGPRNVEKEMRGALTPAWRKAYIHLMSTGAVVDFAGDATPQDALLAAAAWTEEHKEAVWRRWAPDSGSYINEANPFNGNFQYDFYGGNYDRLPAIKEKYDPTSSLYVQSGVGSHLWHYDLNTGKLCRQS